MEFSLVSQLRNELESAWSGYPDYVYSGAAPSPHVPVFVYHTIEPSSFEKDLQHLADGGYTPIGMEALKRHVTGEERAPEGAVVLTFDDARSSFWRYAYPLLRRYEMKGVLFVIAGLTREASSVRENLTDVWDGTCREAELRALDPDDETLCTWPELGAMYDSGWVEIESHSLFHQEVFVGTEIEGFLGPGSNFVPFHTPATAYLTPDDVGGIEPERYYGLPLFQTAPLHKGRRAWVPSEELKGQAKAIWGNLPDEAVARGAWEEALRERWNGLDLRRGLRRQSRSEREQALTDDVARARDLIKEHIDPTAGDHFCLPYTVGSALSVQVMREVGVESCAWGVLPECRHNRYGTDPLRISREKSDFLWRLPGAGQKSLVRIYGEKVGRRLRGERVF